MAYRGGAGFVVAIIILSVLAVFFGAMYFQREAEINKVNNIIRNGSTMELSGPDYGNTEVKALVGKAKDLEERAIPELQKQLAEVTAEREALKVAKDSEETKRGECEAEIARLRTRTEELNKQVQMEQESAKTVREARNADLEAQNAQLQQVNQSTLQQLSQHVQKIKRLEEEIETRKEAAHKRIMDLQKDIYELRQVIDKMSKDKKAEMQYAMEDYDGKIIQADIDNKFVVLNLGSANRVRRGMRFDVIRWRLNKWDFMASVQVTEVSTTTCNAVIMDEIVQQKVCPVTGWVAPSNDYLYSPFVTSGADSHAVELVKTEVVEKSSMRKMDPIVVGDFVTNPFYSKDRMLRFVLAGEPVQYSMNEIKEQIRSYGGVVQDKVEADTDYLVLGKIPSENDVLENEEAKKVRESAIDSRDTAGRFGVPIMREVNLFNFLKR